MSARQNHTPVKPRIAVLLAAYNGVHWLEEQIESIRRQTAVDLTIYISVDPSTDGTEQWCAASAAKYSDIVLLPVSEVFGGAARNFFRLIRDVAFDGYDYVAFSDQDDIWDADKLERSVAMLQHHQGDAYSSNVTAFWPDGRTRVLDKAQPQAEWDFLFEAAGPGCTYVFRRGLADALKESMLRNWELLQSVSLHDWYFYAFARTHGYKWFIDAHSTMQYRQHQHNQVGANTGIKSLIARYKAIQDGWWFSQVNLISGLVGADFHPFACSSKPMGRFRFFALSLNAWKCRRRVRDKIFFFFVCCLRVIAGG
ncbi:glycosyl transferase [Pseudomonas asplenii]|nr:glycosyltransferase [Pseudomonas asplenii]PNG44328.1 glycosyl transferase [Pseudomonas asplenii]